MPRILRGSLIEVLAGRGELSAARLLRELGGFRNVTSEIVTRMFPDLSAADISHVFQLAAAGLSAAAALNFAPAGAEIDPLNFPVNFQLFAGTPSAARGLISAEVVPPGEGLERAIRLTIEVVGSETAGQLRQMARDELARRIDKSPEAFGLTRGEANDIVDDLIDAFDPQGDVIFQFAEARL